MNVQHHMQLALNWSQRGSILLVFIQSPISDRRVRSPAQHFQAAPWQPLQSCFQFSHAPSDGENIKGHHSSTLPGDHRQISEAQIFKAIFRNGCKADSSKSSVMDPTQRPNLLPTPNWPPTNHDLEYLHTISCLSSVPRRSSRPDLRPNLLRISS